MKPHTLTLVVLSQNQSEQIQALLSVARPFVESILIWDDHSTDDIRAVAKAFQAEIHTHAVHGDFAAHRNAALQKVKTEWTVFLDGDESASKKWWQELRELIEQDTADAICTPRRDFFLGRWLQHGETGSMVLLRAARPELGKDRWQRPVHETWEVPSARTVTMTEVLQHTPHPTISAFLAKLNAYALIEPSATTHLPSFITTIVQLFLYPPAKWLKAVVWQQGWRDGIPGIIHASLMAYFSLIKRVVLYEATLPHSR